MRWRSWLFPASACIQNDSYELLVETEPSASRAMIQSMWFTRGSANCCVIQLSTGGGDPARASTSDCFGPQVAWVSSRTASRSCTDGPCAAAIEEEAVDRGPVRPRRVGADRPVGDARAGKAEHVPQDHQAVGCMSKLPLPSRSYCVVLLALMKASTSAGSVRVAPVPSAPWVRVGPVRPRPRAQDHDTAIGQRVDPAIGVDIETALRVGAAGDTRRDEQRRPQDPSPQPCTGQHQMSHRVLRSGPGRPGPAGLARRAA